MPPMPVNKTPRPDLKQWFLILWLALSGAAPLPGQDAAEVRMFSAAMRRFNDGLYEQAENEFAQFLQKFPETAQVADAVLYQARAALKQQKIAAAAALLAAQLPKAGLLTDQYRYWLAEAQLQSSNYLAAAESFALLAREHTNSARLLEASYGEAKARFKLRDWPRVAGLLQAPNGTFQQAAGERANDELVVSGHLLLGEALLEMGEFARAEQAVDRVTEGSLVPEFKWRRQYLLCRIQRAGRRLDDALAGTTNLLTLAATTRQLNFQAESIALQGSLLAQLGRVEAATNVYQQNLQENVPAEYRRLALLHLIELLLAQNQIAEAAQRLEAFLTKYPGDAASDVALLTLGEIHLKQHFAEMSGTNTVTGTTNHLSQAFALFDRLVHVFTNSALLPKVRLDRGWCLWADGRFAESQPDFHAAAEQLPLSDEQAVARFKLADAQFFQKDYSNALQNYRIVLTRFGEWPRIKSTLFDHALYQILRASLAVEDLAVAGDAVQNLLRHHPDSFFSDRSLLLLGQSLTQADKPVKARELLGDFARRFPNSALLPEVELAAAQTHIRERDWPGALARYDAWLTRHPADEMRPRAEFNRAWVTARAGRETNALALFTNFVAQFPTNEFAPPAKLWVADYYYGQKDWVNAERNYQELFQNWPPSDLTFQARMMAGRAAFARQSYSDARSYYTELINALVKSSNSPPVMLAEAYYELGDAVFQEFITNPAKPAGSFTEAINAFTRVTQDFPTNLHAAFAWGSMGNGYAQLAAITQDAKNYDLATNAYQQAMNLPQADVATRSKAEVGLAIVLEKMAEKKTDPEQTEIFKAALGHYTNLVYGNNLRAGERPDPFWLKEAGLAAARLLEVQKQWAVAINLYQRLGEMVPPLHATLKLKIEKAREQLELEKN